MALSGAIYRRIALFFALNCIFSSANENGTIKQNNQPDFKVSLKHPLKSQENERQKANVWRIFAAIIQCQTLVVVVVVVVVAAAAD